MEVKFGRRVFTLTDKDEICFNGSCYVLATQSYFDGHFNCYPSLAKARAKKMIKDGLLVVKKKGKSEIVYKLRDGITGHE